MHLLSLKKEPNNSIPSHGASNQSTQHSYLSQKFKFSVAPKTFLYSAHTKSTQIHTKWNINISCTLLSLKDFEQFHGNKGIPLCGLSPLLFSPQVSRSLHLPTSHWHYLLFLLLHGQQLACTLTELRSVCTGQLFLPVNIQYDPLRKKWIHGRMRYKGYSYSPKLQFLISSLPRAPFSVFSAVFGCDDDT